MAVRLETKEERLAARLSERHGLSPPVDVEALAHKLADVSEKDFPIEIDGLCLNLKQGKRPKVWISKSLGYHRRRFTLAHEIGHITIPWHVGSIADDLEAGDAGATDDYHYLEGEANRFAAELLMPKQWAASICQRAEHLRDAMHSIAQLADVSLQAAALRTMQLGPPGYLVAAAVDGVVTWAGRTPGTGARAPVRGQSVAAIDMPAFEPAQTLRNKATEYRWWKELEAVATLGKPAAAWRQILEQILLSIPESERFKTRQQINAIVGLALGKLPKGTAAEILYQRVLVSLQNRSDHNTHVVMVRKHPDFDAYVLARIHERAEAS